MARKAGQGKEEEESRARQQEEKTPVREEEEKPACHGGAHHVVEQGVCSEWLFQLSLEVLPPLMFPMTVTPLGWDQDCSLKIRESDVPTPWFLDPGGWSKTAAVSLYFVFPGICTLSL
ncbi:hypothetical protein STEG23_023434, partial [Scotinomys teguina]